MDLSDNGVKELVIICDHAHFSHKNEWTLDCFLSPKGAGHVTLIQEMNGQLSHFTVNGNVRFLIRIVHR